MGAFNKKKGGKLVAGAQHVMSLQKCSEEMSKHSQDWSLEHCAKESAECWLKKCVGSNFDMDTYYVPVRWNIAGRWKSKWV